MGFRNENNHDAFGLGLQRREGDSLSEVKREIRSMRAKKRDSRSRDLAFSFRVPELLGA